MTTKVIQLTRRFKVGATLLDDPDPTLMPAEALSLYEGSYPYLKGCTLSEGEISGDQIVYTARKPAVTTKGRRSVAATTARPKSAALTRLAEWADRTPATEDAGIAHAQGSRWHQVFMLLQRRRLHRERRATVDPFAIPMA